MPSARPLTPREQRSVNAFLLLRHQIHDGPLYTARKLAPTSLTSSSSQKHYGQAQLNAKYANDNASSSARSRAQLDPFTSVPMYSQRFSRQERALPDFSSRPYCPEFVPQELHRTFEGDDAGPGAARAGAAGKKRKKITLSKITALPTAEDVFGINGSGADNEWDVDGDIDGHGDDYAQDGTTKKRTLEALESIGAGEEVAEGDEGELDELDDAEEEEQDEEYDDEDAGDYNAEGYFDDGDEYGEDDGDDDGGRDEY